MKLPVLLLVGAVACGSSGDTVNHLPDAPMARLIVEPADLTVTIVNDTVITQAYTARITDDHNLDIDVTSETTFALRDAR
jgi:hypothetical protein